MRTYAGGPGVIGAMWSKERVTFIDDPETLGGKLMKLSAATSGSGATTEQAEVLGLLIIKSNEMGTMMDCDFEALIILPSYEVKSIKSRRAALAQKLCP